MKGKILKAVFLTGIFCLGACGSSDSGSTTTSGGNATRGATSAALSAGNSSAGAGATSQSLVVQALQLQVKGATVTIPTMELDPVTFACSSGSATSSATIGGTVTTNDTTGEVTALNFTFINSTDFNTCVPEDIASTTDIDESDYSLDGTMSGTGTISGEIDSISFNFPMDGTLTIGGACTGSLTFDMTVTGSGSATALECEGSGAIVGTVCDEAVSCTVSGDCENPTVDC